ncbi:MAG: hypothetical protein ACR2PY_08725 [Salinispira sp.]
MKNSIKQCMFVLFLIILGGFSVGAQARVDLGTSYFFPGFNRQGTEIFSVGDSNSYEEISDALGILANISFKIFNILDVPVTGGILSAAGLHLGFGGGAVFPGLFDIRYLYEYDLEYDLTNSEYNPTDSELEPYFPLYAIVRVDAVSYSSSLSSFEIALYGLLKAGYAFNADHATYLLSVHPDDAYLPGYFFGQLGGGIEVTIDKPFGIYAEGGYYVYDNLMYLYNGVTDYHSQTGGFFATIGVMLIL